MKKLLIILSLACMTVACGSLDESGPLPPVACFTHEVRGHGYTRGSIQVRFNASCTWHEIADNGGSYATWKDWDFGDGTDGWGGEGAFMSHQYRRGGTYIVTLTVVDSRYLEDKVSATIIVE